MIDGASHYILEGAVLYPEDLEEVSLRDRLLLLLAENTFVFVRVKRDNAKRVVRLKKRVRFADDGREVWGGFTIDMQTYVELTPANVVGQPIFPVVLDVLQALFKRK